MTTESTSTRTTAARDDELIVQSEQAEAQADSERAARAANLFDLRRIIGGLFAIYGVILFVLGLAASQKEIDKAAGWNLNLWVGLAMLIVAAIFIGWSMARPLSEQLDE
jgi:cation transport ATPase